MKDGFIEIEGNLFDNVSGFDIDGIIAPVWGHRSILIDDYLKDDYIRRNVRVIDFRYDYDMPYEQCAAMYNGFLNTLVKLGCTRIATYSSYLMGPDGQHCTGSEKVKMVEDILRKWYRRNSNRIECLCFCDFDFKF